MAAVADALGAEVRIVLANILADVRRGNWISPDRNHRAYIKESQDTCGQLTFHPFASTWHADREEEVASRAHEYEHWALHYHLLPYSANWPFIEIDIEAVDDYRGYKVAQAAQRRHRDRRGKPVRDERGRLLKPLSVSSINKTVDILPTVAARTAGISEVLCRVSTHVSPRSVSARAVCEPMSQASGDEDHPASQFRLRCGHERAAEPRDGPALTVPARPPRSIDVPCI